VENAGVEKSGALHIPLPHFQSPLGESQDCQSHVEADRISFYVYFSAPENAFCYFSAFYFSAEKDIRIFVFFSFFGTKWP